MVFSTYTIQTLLLFIDELILFHDILMFLHTSKLLGRDLTMEHLVDKLISLFL